MNSLNVIRRQKYPKSWMNAVFAQLGLNSKEKLQICEAWSGASFQSDLGSYFDYDAAIYHGVCSISVIPHADATALVEMFDDHSEIRFSGTTNGAETHR